jgi:hypothetical protein
LLKEVEGEDEGLEGSEEEEGGEWRDVGVKRLQEGGGGAGGAPGGLDATEAEGTLPLLGGSVPLTQLASIFVKMVGMWT